MELTLHGGPPGEYWVKKPGLPAWQLYERRKLSAPGPGDGGPIPQILEDAVKENERLRAEVIRMREREIVLKKNVGHPLRNARERYAQIETMKGEHPIRMLCDLLSVSPNDVYHGGRMCHWFTTRYSVSSPRRGSLRFRTSIRKGNKRAKSEH